MKDCLPRFLLLACCCIPGLLQAQDSTQTDRFNLSANYQSALHYFGRTDSLKSSGLFPSIGFQSKTGLYAQGNFIFTQNKATPLAYTGTTIEAGYRFPQRGGWSGNIFYTHFLYRDKTTLVQSALNSQAGFNIQYNNPVLNITAGADAKFSSQTDFGVTAGVDHLFLFRGQHQTAFAIDPSFYLYAGTQKFTQRYFEKAGLPLFPFTQTSSREVTKFNILSYEASIPFVFVAGKFNASVTPAYVLPQNLVTVAGRPDLSERGRNMFYVTVSAGVRL
ncbi:hypothetical protein [Sediminibacterium soli]|uniref:hypothetical protein n=1 Tax=Sediminibacterium soli TaxID=2698829 RepID=UPI00137B2535|nr:hypothetical protein [Sediminibacterium soli]NCI45255.1 hypothetical protein [Sediminibacterium soli]